jgi:outer membrane protein OmpA-like peptidoglycan-associated protein
MKRISGIALLALLLSNFPPRLIAQNLGSAQIETQSPRNHPPFIATTTLVERDVRAVNYRARSGSTRVDFRGTSLMRDAEGTAEVQNKRGYTEIEVHVDDVEPAAQFGPEYLTYVLWAITPEGRPNNLGELILDGDDGKLDVTTQLQAFALILTAEPHFAVTQPSDVMVMENAIRKDAEEKVEELQARVGLLQRGQYTANALPNELRARERDGDTPFYLLQARNAVRIAVWAGGEAHARDVLEKARALLDDAERMYARDGNKRDGNKKDIETVSRQSVQIAEDARLLALQRIEELRLVEERRAAAARESLAQAQAAESARLKTEAEIRQQLEVERRVLAEADEREARERAEAARIDAERVRAEAARASAEAAVARQQAAEAKGEAEQAKQQATAAQQAAEAQKQAALLEADRARIEAERARDEASRATQEARIAKERADSEAAAAQKALAAAEKERAELRAQLVDQLNVIMETRDTVRGLIVNMSDVIFDTGQHTLKPGARERLARISGILSSHPGLTIEVEGHTDSIGNEEQNHALSERRAATVKDFLVQQGIPAASITARGFGEARAVASNDTPEGRQRNRRVELVVTGEIIGTTTTTSRLTP